MVPLHTQQQISTQSQSQDKTTYSITPGWPVPPGSGTKGGLVDDPNLLVGSHQSLVHGHTSLQRLTHTQHFTLKTDQSGF